MRRLALLVALTSAAALALAPASPAAAAPSLSYGCSPPTTPTSGSCAQWHNQPVTLIWEWDSLVAHPVGGNCSPQVFGQDNAALPVSCKIEDYGGTSSTEETVFLHIDRTPPQVTTATPDRGPDAGGWWNHAVGYTFAGTDATSGIASCTPVTFEGPGTQLSGSCADKAGNVGTGTFNVAFDDTPPVLAGVKAIAGNRSATLTWQPAGGAVRSQVVRAPGPRGAASGIVYQGTAKRFRDPSLTNGVTYRYTVTTFDQAGNSNSSTAAARPAASKGMVPERGTRVSRAPLLRWPALRGASYYNVQVFRGRTKVLDAWPGHAHMKLRHHWKFAGRRFTLRPGRYRWYVWPGYGSRAAHRYGSFIGQSSFVLAR
jgi:hypothetical protein